MTRLEKFIEMCSTYSFCLTQGNINFKEYVRISQEEGLDSVKEMIKADFNNKKIMYNSLKQIPDRNAMYALDILYEL